MVLHTLPVKRHEDSTESMEYRLAHAIGFSLLPGGLHYHPNCQEYLHAAGATLVINSLAHPRTQSILRGHHGDVSVLALSSTGRLIASGEQGTKSDVIIWDYASRQRLYTLCEHDGAVSGLAFSLDERLLCTTGSVEDSRMVVWDTSSGAIVSSGSIDSSRCTCVAWVGMVRDVKHRPTSEYLLCTASISQTRMWVVNPHVGTVQDVCVLTEGRGCILRDVTWLSFSSTRELMFCTTTSGDIAVVDVRSRTTRMLSAQVSRGGLLAVVAFKQGMIVGSENGTVSLLDSSLGEMSKTQLHGAVLALSLAPLKEHEVLAGSSDGSIYRITTPDLTTSLLISESHARAVRGLAYSAESCDVFATSSLDKTLRVWDAHDLMTSAMATVPEAGDATALCLTVDVVVSGWTDGSIFAHEARGGVFAWRISHAHPRGGVASIILSTNRRFAVSGGASGDIRVWELRSRDLIAQFTEHTSVVTGLTLYLDDTHMLSCSKDRSFLCWDLRSQKRITSHVQPMGGINGIALSEDESCIYTVGQEKRISLWDLRYKSVVKQADIDSDRLDEAKAIAVSHTGHVIATGGTQCGITLWSACDLSRITTLEGHSNTVTGLKFAPDDKQLVSIGEDGSIFVWSAFFAST